jgi:hypothetical protein
MSAVPKRLCNLHSCRMSDDEPIILSYATPKPVSGFAGMPEIVIVLLAVLVPGLSSSLIRRSAWPCLFLVASVPLAFGVFGPLWGEVFFRSPALKDAGLYPFLFTCALVAVISAVMAISDRKRALRAESGTLIPLAGPASHDRTEKCDGKS